MANANAGLSKIRGGFSKLFFGAEIKDPVRDADQKIINKQTLVALENDEAADLVDISHYYSNGFISPQTLQSTADIINEYRSMSVHAEVDRAIDDIINEAVTSDADEDVVTLVFDETLESSEEIRIKIEEEFLGLLRMIKFDVRSYEIFRQWYVDGRLYYHKIIDPQDMKKGILKLVNLDPRAIKKIKEVLSETDPETKIDRITDTRSYFLYDPTYINTISTNDNASARSSANRIVHQALELSEDTVAFIHSGIITGDNKNMVLSHLEKARKPLNNLRMLEDAVVIYRITRAPERRLFYVDVGSLPKKGAEEYMAGLINKYRTRLVYDGSTGQVKGNSHQVSMMEDYWLPRREGGKGTEISTLPGGENLGKIDDLLYFQKKLYVSLNVPQSRLDNEATISIGNRMAEITRDEWKFNKFVQRLRRRFNGLFLDLLRTQLILKNITNAEDWDNIISPKIRFEYASDSFVKEQQDAEQMDSRLAQLEQIDPYVGKYYSAETVKKKVLRQSDEEIKYETDQIAKEIKAGLYPHPSEVIQMDAGIHPDQIQHDKDLAAAKSKGGD